ncbi:PKD domain-containing protein [Candidatus Kaiserbacteria bacterium]|nr:PKD domain-containing protein [Candidatus Kaiserbacteria bacterium]
MNYLKRSFAVALTIVSLGAMPIAAGALTVDEVQAQIQSLLSQISSLTNILNTLRGQANTGVGVSGSAVSPEPARHRICGVVWRNLSQGAQGDDVRAMQEFLSEQGYLSANATGYFGPMTAKAVASWQTSQGVSAVGAFGPMSRERVKMWCGGGGGGSLQASPTRGNAPLTVYFWHVIGGGASEGYSIDFGDGTTGTLDIGCGVNPQSGVGACPRALTASHTYTQNGTYTATLVHYTNPCAGVRTAPTDGPGWEGITCMAPISQEIVGKVQINVGQVACTMEYKPVCGSKQIYCSTTPCNPVQQTYGNKCTMEADGATFLYDGQCQDVYGNRPPVISGFSGPTTLSVNQTGTWTINASDPENGQLSYRVSWGDENYGLAPHDATLVPLFIQTTTFTHAYANAGTYTVSVTVQDSNGQSAQTTTTVQVGSGVACTMEYAPVCGQPPEPACRHSIPACMIATPGPQTYSNRCMLNAAGATFLYQGQCANMY